MHYNDLLTLLCLYYFPVPVLIILNVTLYSSCKGRAYLFSYEKQFKRIDKVAYTAILNLYIFQSFIEVNAFAQRFTSLCFM